MSYFAKLDSDLKHSSILAHGARATGVWLYVVSQKDEFGIVSESPETVSEKFPDVSLEDARVIWELFTSPDPMSKCKDFEGRRLIPTSDSRWIVVAHDRYQKRYTKENKREIVRDAKRRAAASGRPEACGHDRSEARGLDRLRDRLEHDQLAREVAEIKERLANWDPKAEAARILKEKKAELRKLKAELKALLHS